MKRILILITLFILFAGCEKMTEQVKPLNEAKSSLPRNLQPDSNKESIEKVVDGNTDFAINLYKNLPNQEENIIFSPYSISLALAMTQAGAREETLKQMNDVLRFALSSDELHPLLNALQLELNARENNESEENAKDFELNITNALWGEQSYTFLPSYLDLLAENYGAGLHLMDFINEPEKSRQEINQWVSDETKNKINNLLSEGSISSLTRLVLTNAIYFKANWMSQFEEALTHEGNFTLLDGTIVQVPMMQQTASFGYYSAEGYQAITLPYEGNKISMLVLLPDGGRFKEMEDAISNNQIKEIIANTQYTQVNLNFPKFKIETSFGLADILGQMGMPDAFSPGVADFSGMDGTKDLYISAILHKAYIDVDENGTEAAAATAVVVGVTSMPLDPIQVSIDRPFIFFIVDNESESVLFIGKVVNPGSEQ